MFPIKRTKFESDSETDFVAIANLHFDHIAAHSAFIINHKKQLTLFHYTGTSVEYGYVDEDYYHRNTDTIAPDEVPSFIAFCQYIKKKAKPKYGYFYSGESYDSEGNHISNSYSGERMTCVGFCLNVLKGFLEEDYINYKDWDEDSHEDRDYLDRYCKKHNLNPDNLQKSHRRINPRECLASAFFNNLPIRKVSIDEKSIFLNQYFDNFLKVISDDEEE